MGRWLRRGLVMLFGLYLAYGAAMVWLHPQFIYPFSQETFDAPGFDVVPIAVAGMDPVPAYVHSGATSEPLVLYFMGNRGAVVLFRGMLEHHKTQGRGVAAMAFRGGGGVAGTPSEAVLKRDALAVFDAMRAAYPDRQIFVQGYSLGTGLATYVAANRDTEGVLLSAPYESLCRLMANASGLPACWMPVQRWNSAADAPDVTEPVLILHGTADSLIPFAEGARLAARFDPDVVTMTAIEGAGHVNLTQFPDYYPAIDAFFSR